MKRAASVVMVIVFAGSVSAQVLDLSEKVKPTCELAGLVARPPAGWINVPIEGAPAGHLGCQMLRVNEEQELMGILRIRSVSAPAKEYRKGGDASALIASERKIMERMNIAVADEPLWTRDKVPIRGPGFSQAGGAGYAAMIEGAPVPQEVHFLTFHAEDASYLISLVTPSKSDAAETYQRNTDDFGVVMRSLNVK